MSFGLYFEVCTKKIRISKKNRIYGPIFGGKWRKWLFFGQNKWYFRKHKLYFNSVALGWKYYQNATLQPLNGLCSFNIKRVIADRISRKTQFFIKICLFCWFFPNFSGTSGIIRKLLRLGDRAMKTLRNELLYDTVGHTKNFSIFSILEILNRSILIVESPFNCWRMRNGHIMPHGCKKKIDRTTPWQFFEKIGKKLLFERYFCFFAYNFLNEKSNLISHCVSVA